MVIAVLVVAVVSVIVVAAIAVVVVPAIGTASTPEATRPRCDRENHPEERGHPDAEWLIHAPLGSNRRATTVSPIHFTVTTMLTCCTGVPGARPMCTFTSCSFAVPAAFAVTPNA